MLTKKLFLIVFSAIVNIQWIAVAQGAAAQDANPPQIEETQEQDPQKDEKETPDQLRPTQLINYDGTTYMYEGDCCMSDGLGGGGHVGFILSARALNAMPCPTRFPCGDAPLTLDYECLELPAEFGSERTDYKLYIGVHESFNERTQPGSIGGFFDRPGFRLRDYYGGVRLATAVTLKDQNDVTRVFTLVKCTMRINKGNEELETVSYPLLTLSRNQPQITQLGLRLNPRRQFHPDGYSIPAGEVEDLQDPQIKVVTITVPNPRNMEEEVEIKCLLVNRRLP